jgi:hypothetical protein
MLIHSQHQRASAITANIWYHALRMADALNAHFQPHVEDLTDPISIVYNNS